MEVKKQYLPLATKRQIIETIKNNAINENEYGMKYIDHIGLQLATDISLLQFYCEQSLEDVDIDELYKDQIIEKVREQIPKSEIDFIEDNTWYLLKDECESYNSLAGVINRNLQALISKIPDEKSMTKIINKLPKALEKIDPNTLSILQGIMDGKVK